jgi:DNA-binding PadR family transcriptional regulator
VQQQRELLTGEYAVLGLLALRPMHGYEMARFFDRDDLAEVCPLEQSLLYTYIRNVEERAFVAWTEQRVGLRPPRKIYHLTPPGRAHLEAWLEAPVQRMRQVRLEFLLKLYFLHHLDPAAERALLHAQIAVCEAYRERLELRVQDESGFERLVALSKATAAEATANWLIRYQTELQHEPAGVDAWNA